MSPSAQTTRESLGKMENISCNTSDLGYPAPYCVIDYNRIVRLPVNVFTDGFFSFFFVVRENNINNKYCSMYTQKKSNKVTIKTKYVSNGINVDRETQILWLRYNMKTNLNFVF